MELTLQSFLTWVLAGGGASILVRWIISRIPSLMEKISEQERALISGALTAVFMVGAFVARVMAGYTPAPATTLEWAETIFMYVATAVGIPSIMSVFMRTGFEVRVRRGAYIADAAPEANKLFGIRW